MPVTKEMAASIAGRHADRNKIGIVGAFPPPVYGMAVVNAAVRDTLRQAGVTATVIGIAPVSIGLWQTGAAWGDWLGSALCAAPSGANGSYLAGTGEAKGRWLGGRAVNPKVFLMEVV